MSNTTTSEFFIVTPSVKQLEFIQQCIDKLPTESDMVDHPYYLKDQPTLTMGNDPYIWFNIPDINTDYYWFAISDSNNDFSDDTNNYIIQFKRPTNTSKIELDCVMLYM